MILKISQRTQEGFKTIKIPSLVKLLLHFLIIWVYTCSILYVPHTGMWHLFRIADHAAQHEVTSCSQLFQSYWAFSWMKRKTLKRLMWTQKNLSKKEVMIKSQFYINNYISASGVNTVVHLMLNKHHLSFFGCIVWGWFKIIYLMLLAPVIIAIPYFSNVIHAL